MAGSSVWLAVCVMTVALRGVRWDETYEFAQVILGQVKMPDGHPLLPYVRNAYSLQVYGSAMLLWATQSALLVNAIRNFLFIGATVLPAYVFGARMSGRALYGHIAALLVLAGVHLELRSTYPQFVWPDIFSNGHIGTGWALLTLCFLAAGPARAGFFMAGLMPCIHVGQLPPVFIVMAYITGVRLRERSEESRRQVRSLALWLCAGLGVSIVFWLAQRPFLVDVAPTGAYAATGDTEKIWRTFVANYDIHRALPPLNGQIGLALLIGLCVLMARLKSAKPLLSPWTIASVYAASLGMIVWSTMVIHAALGEYTPRLMLQWMPYRLINHAQPLLLAAACAALGRTAGLRLIPAGILAVAVVLPYTQQFWPASLYARYLAPSAGLVFVLTGAALFAAVPQTRRALGYALAGALIVGVFHHFGGACLALGALAAWGLSRKSANASPLPHAGVVCWLAVVLACAIMLIQQSRQHATLPVGGFEKSVASYLAARGDGGAVLVADPKQLLLQAKTNHPVISDMALPYMITYLPGIGPSVNKLYEDVYGISFIKNTHPDWREVWKSRPRADWHALAERYGFRYIVAPAATPLNLPLCLKTPVSALYLAARR